MRILALETSTKTGSIAALVGEKLVRDMALPVEMRTAQSLAPSIADLLASCQWRPADIELIAVTLGPGSFTGLRIGVTTAKTLAYAVGAEVIGVNTLEAIAASASKTEQRTWSAIDAGRRQVFAACFHRDQAGSLSTVNETTILDIDDWIGRLKDEDHVAGSVLDKLLDRLPPHISIVPSELWTPQASTVGSLAFAAYQSGRRDDFWKLVPQYYRKSAAEEKLPGQAR